MRGLAHILVAAALLLLRVHPVYGGPSGTINGAGSPAGMVLIPAGPFLYGEKGKEQELSLPAFLMDLNEVTHTEYAKVSPREYPPEKAPHPVVGVTWDEAKQYCGAVGKRLPSEQEWEKAARGTDGRRYPWGDAYDPKKVNADGLNNGTTPVGQFPEGRSPYGLYDMAGNAWEWTDSAGSNYKPLRGGAWNSGMQFVGTTVRIWNDPSYRDEAFGFRCVKDGPK
ncbi:MAG: formylglycine-generating enzyme family protein [Candidatus Methylomirabilales bacterium]